MVSKKKQGNPLKTEIGLNVFSLVLLGKTGISGASIANAIDEANNKEYKSKNQISNPNKHFVEPASFRGKVYDMLKQFTTEGLIFVQDEAQRPKIFLVNWTKLASMVMENYPLKDPLNTEEEKKIAEMLAEVDYDKLLFGGDPLHLKEDIQDVVRLTSPDRLPRDLITLLRVSMASLANGILLYHPTEQDIGQAERWTPQVSFIRNMMRLPKPLLKKLAYKEDEFQATVERIVPVRKLGTNLIK